MKNEKKTFNSLSEIERKYFPKAYEQRHSKQLLDNPEEAGRIFAQQLMSELKK
jgi:hypothetical protein